MSGVAPAPCREQLFGELGGELAQLFSVQAGCFGGQLHRFGGQARFCFLGTHGLALVRFFLEAFLEQGGRAQTVFVSQRFTGLAVQIVAMRGFFG